MMPSTRFEELMQWLCGLPVAFAYRIIWLAAKLNLGSSRDVYQAMWDANLNLPPLAKEPKA